MQGWQVRWRKGCFNGLGKIDAIVNVIYDTMNECEWSVVKTEMFGGSSSLSTGGETA